MHTFRSPLSPFVCFFAHTTRVMSRVIAQPGIGPRAVVHRSCATREPTHARLLPKASPSSRAPATPPLPWKNCWAPVVVSEWGFQPDTDKHYRGTADDFGRPFVKEFLEGRGLHSVAWCWHPDVGPPMLKFDWKTPTAYGAFVRDYLREHNK